MTAPIKLVIFLSGRGSNFQAIFESIQKKKLNAEIVAVVSDKPHSKGVEFAREQGLNTIVRVPNTFPDLAAFESDLLAQLKLIQIDLVVLAGYMRIVGPVLLQAFRGKIINIHPSLLPKYKGLHAQKQAIEDGATESGCTVHFVVESLDGGPIIAQVSVPVFSDDTEETLSNRILKEEHQLLPETIRQIQNQMRNGEVK